MFEKPQWIALIIRWSEMQRRDTGGPFSGKTIRLITL
jgi:hypothetical protein